MRYGVQCAEQAVERVPDLGGVQGQAEQEGSVAPENLTERELHPCLPLAGAFPHRPSFSMRAAQTTLCVSHPHRACCRVVSVQRSDCMQCARRA